MLPSERNERLVWRISLALIILMALFVVIWTARFINRRAHRLLQQRNIPVDEGRARVMEMA
jgi:hypothetical protein